MRERRVDTAVRLAIYRRNYRRARDRALTRLSRLYPDDYARLFAEERERDELEGKKWTDIGDSAYDSPDRPRQRHESYPATTNESAGVGAQDQGNVGGEA